MKMLRKIQISILFFVFLFVLKWPDGDDARDGGAGVVGDPSDRLNLPVRYRTTCRCRRPPHRRCCAPPSSTAALVDDGDDFCH